MNIGYRTQHEEAAQERFGLRIAARLSAGAQDLPHELRERLRAAREQALDRRRQAIATAAPQVAKGNTGFIRLGPAAALLPSGGSTDFWNRIGSMFLLALLLVGLIVIQRAQNKDHALDVAHVDAALLTDELPLEAYADPGFLQFLKSGSGQAPIRQPAAEPKS